MRKSKHPNKVKIFRTKLDMTQRALADAVGVSQQHIQRIETQPDINVGFRLAVKLCGVLGRSLVEIFPQTRHILERVPAEQTDALPTMLNASEEMEAAGVNMDGSEHYIALRLRGQTEPVVIKLADGEKSRLWKELQSAEGFIEFEGTRATDDHRTDDDKAAPDDEKRDDLEKPTKRRYLVRAEHLLGWHFLFEGPLSVWGQETYREQQRKAKDTDFERDPEEGPYQSVTVKIWFADGTPPWEHQAEPDDDDARDEEGDFGNLFAMLRNDYDEESQFTTDFHFIDEDGEVVWVHTKEMALISVPEHVIARERTAEEWDAKTAEVTPVTALKPVVVPRPQKAQHETKAAIVKEKP
jgi:DNA-binding XRE family transcriptional regulator